MNNPNFWIVQFPIFQKSNYAENFSIIGIPIMLTTKFAKIVPQVASQKLNYVFCLTILVFELQDEDKICCHNFATLVPGLQNLAQDNLKNANPFLRHMLDSIPMETDVSARFMDLVSEIILQLPLFILQPQKHASDPQYYANNVYWYVRGKHFDFWQATTEQGKPGYFTTVRHAAKGNGVPYQTASPYCSLIIAG